MSIPAEASELQSFVPPSLANVAGAPAFKLRPATKREMRSYRFAMDEEGLQYHQQDEMRAEVLRALRQLYTPVQYEEAKASLLEFWMMVDQKIDPPEAQVAEVNDLVARLMTAWRPLSRMMAENRRFLDESLRIALSLFLVGWSNLDLEFRLEMGRAPLDLLDEVEMKLREIERRAVADKVAGVAEGIAFLQLCSAAQARMNLTKDEEKNFDSPPSSQPTPNGSTTRRSSKTRGAGSKASASSASTKG